MAKTSFVDHVARTGIPNAGPKLKGTTNSEEWGARVAVERGYGPGVRTFPPPKDQSAPQKLGDQNNLRGPLNDVANDWRRGVNQDATTKPNFDHSKGKR